MRYEFEPPDKRGRRRVRAYDGDRCVMSGILLPKSVTLHPAEIAHWCAGHESAPVNESSDARGVAQKAIDEIEKLANGGL